MDIVIWFGYMGAVIGGVGGLAVLLVDWLEKH